MKLVVLLLLLVPLLVSCGRRQEATLYLPSVRVMISDSWYGMINTAYVRLNSQIGGQGEAGLTLRGGDIVTVTQIRTFFTGGQLIWHDYYYVVTEQGSGWASSQHVNLFNHYQTALDAQARYRRLREF